MGLISPGAVPTVGLTVESLRPSELARLLLFAIAARHVADRSGQEAAPRLGGTNAREIPISSSEA